MKSISSTLVLSFGLGQALGSPTPATIILEGRSTLNTTVHQSAMYDTTCNWDRPFRKWGRVGVMGCQGELANKGKRSCVANPSGNMCRYQPPGGTGEPDTYVSGLARDGTDYAASACQDVAAAVKEIYDICNRQGQYGDTVSYGGSAAARGNGDLIVHVQTFAVSRG